MDSLPNRVLGSRLLQRCVEEVGIAGRENPMSGASNLSEVRLVVFTLLAIVSAGAQTSVPAQERCAKAATPWMRALLWWIGGHVRKARVSALSG